MESDVFQQLIDGCSTAEDMTSIARGYLQGRVIRDKVAAQAWLMKAIEADDPVASPQAMGILAREILGKKQVIPESEVPELRQRLLTARGREKSELEALLKLV